MAEKTIHDLAREAILVQDASNLRGVLLAWHKAICHESVPRGGQVEEFLNVLYLSKVASLLHADADAIGSVTMHSPDDPSLVTDFGMAYAWAERTKGDAHD